MVAPGFLANPEVRRWLNGVEPAWTMLEFDSFKALHDEPSANNNAIRLEPKLTTTEVSASAVAGQHDALDATSSRDGRTEANRDWNFFTNECRTIRASVDRRAFARRGPL